jgi:hypothetical protein
MSKKQPRTIKHPSAVSSDVSAREIDAVTHLEKERYRDAIEAFKGLLKQEKRPEWIDGLAAAYAGRALALAGKGMRREAIALWKNRAEVCGKPLWEGFYAEWILAEGQLVEVLKYLSSRRAAQASNEELSTLEASIAPAILGADDAELARLSTAIFNGSAATLSAEAPLLRHRPAALAALTACAQGDATALDTALAGIPFRSPYRDLRPLLKAMRLLESDPVAARAAIARLPVDGPFERLAAPLRSLGVTDGERLRAIVKLEPAQQKLAFDLWGCPATLAPLLRTLAIAEDEARSEALFERVLKNYRVLPDALAGRIWRRLAAWSPKLIGESLPLFGKQPSGVAECVQALAYEMAGDLRSSEHYWHQAAERLAASGQTDDPLRAALILRHTALSPAHFSREGVLDSAGEAMLTRSLQLDANDVDAHAKVIEFWRRNGNLKTARVRLETALSIFKDDTAILAEAVEIALASGAFKKAATSARRLLELDPLNSKVRSLVGNAHLSHASKQIAANKPEAARKEIAEADPWLRLPVERGRMSALSGWVEPVGSPLRVQALQAAVACWGGGLAAGWRLLREAQKVFTHADQGLLLREAGIDPRKPLLADDLLNLVQALEEVPFRAAKGLDALHPWRKAIEKLAPVSVLDRAAGLRICEALARHREYLLVEKFAEAARRRWPKQAIFVYHAVAARFEKHHFIKSNRDLDDLEAASLRAQQEKDLRLVMRIETLFTANEEDGTDFDDDDFPFDPSNLDGDALREMMRMTIMMLGEKGFLEKMRDTVGAERIKQIEKECNGNRKAILERIIDFVVEFTLANAIPQKYPAAPRPAVKKTPFGQRGLFDD